MGHKVHVPPCPACKHLKPFKARRGIYICLDCGQTITVRITHTRKRGRK